MAKENPLYDPKDTMRQRPLRNPDDTEMVYVEAVKKAGQAFFDYVASLPANRENSIAKTKIEEAVMWAVKGVTE